MASWGRREGARRRYWWRTVRELAFMGAVVVIFYWLVAWGTLFTLLEPWTQQVAESIVGRTPAP
jgi:hypothetical protein